ncbi:MAG UNVERIFIED_CONTAM: ankyrin repeat domain-containing protein [Rickettsiaceae bacterium]|jgi:ankyrin repeat protein
MSTLAFVQANNLNGLTRYYNELLDRITQDEGKIADPLSYLTNALKEVLTLSLNEKGSSNSITIAIQRMLDAIDEGDNVSDLESYANNTKEELERFSSSNSYDHFRSLQTTLIKAYVANERPINGLVEQFSEAAIGANHIADIYALHKLTTALKVGQEIDIDGIFTISLSDYADMFDQENPQFEYVYNALKTFYHTPKHKLFARKPFTDDEGKDLVADNFSTHFSNAQQLLLNLALSSNDDSYKNQIIQDLGWKDLKCDEESLELLPTDSPTFATIEEMHNFLLEVVAANQPFKLEKLLQYPNINELFNGTMESMLIQAIENNALLSLKVILELYPDALSTLDDEGFPVIARMAEIATSNNADKILEFLITRPEYNPKLDTDIGIPHIVNLMMTAAEYGSVDAMYELLNSQHKGWMGFETETRMPYIEIIMKNAFENSQFDTFEVLLNHLSVGSVMSHYAALDKVTYEEYESEFLSALLENAIHTDSAEGFDYLLNMLSDIIDTKPGLHLFLFSEAASNEAEEIIESLDENFLNKALRQLIANEHGEKLTSEEIENLYLAIMELKQNTIINDEGQTPLLYALHIGNMDMVRYLLSNEEQDLTYQDNFGANALHYLVLLNDVTLLRSLTKMEGFKEAANQQSNDGDTPLILAIKEGGLPYHNIVNTLLHGGADPYITDKDGYTADIYALFAAAETPGADARSFISMMHYHLSGQKDHTAEEIFVGTTTPSESGKNDIHNAVIGGDLTTLKELLKSAEKEDIDAQTSSGSTPLILAIKVHGIRSYELVDALLKANADATIQDHAQEDLVTWSMKKLFGTGHKDDVVEEFFQMIKTNLEKNVLTLETITEEEETRDIKKESRESFADDSGIDSEASDSDLESSPHSPVSPHSPDDVFFPLVGEVY